VEKLARQASAVASFPDVDVVFCDTRAIRGGSVAVPSRFALGGIHEASVERRGALLRFDRSILPFLLTQSRLFPSAVVVRASTPGLAFREDLRRAEDWALWLQLCLESPFAAVDEVLVDMHYEGDNLSSATAETLADGVRVLEEMAVSCKLRDEERRAIEEAMEKKRAGALYHSIREGQSSLARELLRQQRPRAIGPHRWWAYWLLSRLPGSVSRWLASSRGSTVPGSRSS
jgi:hypothetical protein